MTFVEFVQGPLWIAALTIFLAGVVWRIVAVLRLGRREDLSEPRASAWKGAVRANLAHFFPSGAFARRTSLHVVAGYMFHLGLFALLLFAAPHVKFIEERLLGFGWTPMPHWAFVLAAQISFAGLLMLYLRRLTDPVLKLISDADDHIGTVLTFLVMLTGCMALAQSFPALAVTHLLLVEVWLVYFPFSRLMHAFMFAFSRGYTGAVYGRRGEVL
jgi:nitrate reductase gamma subunit